MGKFGGSSNMLGSSTRRRSGECPYCGTGNMSTKKEWGDYCRYQMEFHCEGCKKYYWIDIKDCYDA